MQLQLGIAESEHPLYTRTSLVGRKVELMNIQNPSMASITLNASEPSSTVNLHGQDHLFLMRMVFDDRFGNPDKRNGAFEQDRRMAEAKGAVWNCLNFDSPIGPPDRATPDLPHMIDA